MCGCSSGSLATPGHPYTELNRRLVDSSSVRAVSTLASRCCSHSHERLGVKAKRKGKCAFSSTEDHLSGRDVGFANLTTVKRVREGQTLTVKLFQKLLVLMAAASILITFGVVAQDHRVFPEGQPISQDQGQAAMLMCLRHVEETMVPVIRPCVGGSLSSCNANDGRIPHRLGSGHGWPLRPRSVGRSPSHVAHQLPGDSGSISSFETLSPRPERPSCASTHRQYVGGLLDQPPGGSAFVPFVQAGAPDPPVGPGETALPEGSVHPWVPQSGSRHPVETGATARGLDAPHRGDGADLKEVCSSPGGLI